MRQERSNLCQEKILTIVIVFPLSSYTKIYGGNEKTKFLSESEEAAFQNRKFRSNKINTLLLIIIILITIFYMLCIFYILVPL